MEIGPKLREARLRAALTQEQAARQIGVTRQSLSNWERGRTYPDIVSVIRMSDLYGISLDALLKGDATMITHLAESTDTATVRKRHLRMLAILSYLVVWCVSVMVFWLGGRMDAMGYSLVVLWGVLPLSALAVSVLIGRESGRLRYVWLWVLLSGALYTAAHYMTFSLANTLAFGNVHIPDPIAFVAGCACSAVGVLAGVLGRRLAMRRESACQTDQES